jgi:hypothetical protein
MPPEPARSADYVPVCRVCWGRILWCRVDKEWSHYSDPPRTLFPLHDPDPAPSVARNDGQADA